GAVQNVGRSDAAGQRAVNRDVLGVDYVLNIDHGGNGNTPLVDVAVHRDVGVAVDDAGDDVLPAAIDHFGPLRNHDLLADLGDLTVLDDDRSLQRPFRDRHNGRVLDDDGFGAKGRDGRGRRY